MTTLLMTLLVLAAIAVFLIRAKAKPPTKAEGGIEVGFGFQATDQQVELENQSNEEIMQLLEASMVTSGLFRAEKISELVAKLRGGFAPFCHVNTEAAFGGDTLLTAGEKKALGLNTRMKYSREFIECFDPSVFKAIEPKATLGRMHFDAFHRVSRKRELLRLKKLDFRQVKIVPMGGGLDCARIKRFKKIYPIEDVPELPLPGCNAPFCRCMYQPVFPNN